MTEAGSPPAEGASSSVDAQPEPQEQDAELATYTDIILLCHPRNVGNLVRAFEAQIQHAAGELPMFVIWSGVSGLLHQGVVVLEWKGKVTPAFLHSLSIDHEVFDYVVYEYRWSEDEENQESGSEQEAQAHQSTERNRIDGGSSYNYYEEVLERARVHNERILEEVALNNLGWIYSAWGKKKLERKYYEEALTISREIGDRRGEAATLNNLGRVAEDTGDYEQAQRYYQEALSIFQALGDRHGCGWALNNLGRASYFLAGDHAFARECLEEALRIRREVDRKGESRTLNNLGAVATGDGDYRQSWAYEMEALTISEEVADQEGRGKIYRNLGQLCLAQKRYPEALAFLLCARSILDSVQSPGREKVLDYMDNLRREVGDEEFFGLLTHVEPRAEVLAEQTLKKEAASR